MCALERERPWSMHRVVSGGTPDMMEKFEHGIVVRRSTGMKAEYWSKNIA